MFRTAYLQHAGSGPLRHEEALLTEGLTARGIPIEHYTPKRLHRRDLPLAPDTFLAGDTDTVHSALRQLRIPIPDPDDYPESLRPFLHRRVWRSTLGELERTTDGPVFVKPAQRRKQFPGTVCYSERDIARLGGISRRRPIWCSDVVRWQAEFRVCVIGDRLAAVDHYAGDGDALLDLGIVRRAVATYRRSGTAPGAYALDFGVLASGETALVEANDGYALGAYAITADDYTDLLLTRWRELLRSIGASRRDDWGLSVD